MSSTTHWMPELLGEHPAEPQRVARRVPLGHQQPEDPLRTKRPGAQGGHNRAVDPARDAHDGPAPAQVAEDDRADGRLDLLDRLPGIDPQHLS